jgi:aspartokinase/homoserine dehydrogenase 1
LIAVDNTAMLLENYISLAENSFDFISSNKVANTLWFYKELRKVLAENQKNYLYETNVGAGLPLIDTKLLHLSGENITKKGFLRNIELFV